MGVDVQTKVTVICDICKQEITAGKMIEAGTYGVYAGEACFARLTPWQVIRLLGLDEVRIGPRTDFGFGSTGTWWNPEALDEGKVRRVYETVRMPLT